MLLRHCPLEYGGERGGRGILCSRASARPLLHFLLALLSVVHANVSLFPTVLVPLPE